MILGKSFLNGVENAKLYLGSILVYSGVSTDFIMTVKTDNVGTSNNDQFTIPTIAGNSYNVTTSDGQTLSNNTDDLTITFPSAGTYDVNISGDFRQLRFSNGGDKSKLLDVKNWGNIAWASFERAFWGCNNFTSYSATDKPDLSNVTNMGYTFTTSAFNQDISSWNVSNVTSMQAMFRGCYNFNSDLSSWDVSNATDISFMFQGAFLFNQDITGWNTSSAITMKRIFINATSFDRNLAGWDVNQATDLSDFLQGSTLSTANYDATLIGWANQIPLSFNGTLNFGSSTYTLGGAAATARAALVSDVGAVSDGGGV